MTATELRCICGHSESHHYGGCVPPFPAPLSTAGGMATTDLGGRAMAIVCESASASMVRCPGCMGNGMSSRTTDGEGGPGRCEACAGVGMWTVEEMARYEDWLNHLDNSRCGSWFGAEGF